MRKILGVLLSLMLVFMVGCNNGDSSDKTITDREGNEVVIPDNIERIVSTAPSNTEIIVELGLSDKLVCVDTYSLGIEGLSEGIENMDFTAPDAEAIVELDPDIIVASGYNKSGSADDPFKAISDAGIAVVYVPSSESIEGIYEDITFIADTLNVSEKGEAIVAQMKEKVEEISAIGKTITEKKKVYFEIGPAPTLYSIGNETFVNEMIELIGAENIFKNEIAWISPTEEAVIDANPDVILTNVNYLENPTAEITSRDGWEHITAVENQAVYYIDADASSRPTPNIVKALEEMASAIYPDEYNK